MSGTECGLPGPLDLEHLSRQTFGDRELEREVLGLFVDQCLRLIPVIATASARVAKADAAHALRGAALAIGAERVAELSRRLETALGAEETAFGLDGLLASLEEAATEVEIAIAERVRIAA